MKTKKTRRALVSAALLASLAGTLTATTRPVRADSVTSSAIAGATDGSSSTVKPYFWTQAALFYGNSSGLIASDIGALYAYYVATSGSGCTYGVATAAARALPERALD
ncbi:MAG TPA: hypothetical protein VN947_07800 [Polyangia bacterium]|nr:hypothetical protein [Polyangia bacterium]